MCNFLNLNSRFVTFFNLNSRCVAFLKVPKNFCNSCRVSDILELGKSSRHVLFIRDLNEI